MTDHLSSEQISRLIVGEATPEQQQHAGKCAACGMELTRMRSLLSDFRDSVHHWARQSGPATISDRTFLARELCPFQRRSLRWAAVTVAFIILITIPLYKNSSNRHREAETLADTILLEQVNVHLSRSVPAPMEPLMEMLSDASAESVGGRE